MNVPQSSRQLARAGKEVPRTYSTSRNSNAFTSSINTTLAAVAAAGRALQVLFKALSLPRPILPRQLLAPRKSPYPLPQLSHERCQRAQGEGYES